MNEVGALHDAQPTVWTTTDPQRGDEYFIADLGREQPVSGLTIGPGVHPGGYPRALVIELSRDLQTWAEAWRGETTLRSLIAVLADPLEGAMTLEFATAPARYVRVRQTGQSVEDGWTVSEIRIHP